MKRLWRSTVVLGCVLLWLARTPGLAVITVQITPAANQATAFTLSGQFDGPVPWNVGNVVAFSFGPPQMLDGSLWNGNSVPLYAFTTSLATISNVTRHTPAEISYFVPYDYAEFDFANWTDLPIYAGDVLSLTSHGTVVAPALPFARFVPGTYSFANPDLAATFQVSVVPEPTVLSAVGMGLLGWLLRRRLPQR